jgi:ABC-type amino acid transport substrate-binding protein
MMLRRIAALALGVSLPLTAVASASADFGEIRDSLTSRVGSFSDVEAAVVGTSDDDAGPVAALPTSDDFSGVDDPVREEFSTFYDEVKGSIEGSDG